MSELAYNLQGERFSPPTTASAWRVRRLKPGGRGTPDVVFSKDGAPLMLPLEAELAEFRQTVTNQPGRYRLDPVNEDYRSCEGGQPAYLTLSDQEDSAEAPTDPRRYSGGASDDLLRDLVHANTEMVRNIADKFASVMDSAAVLIRAADGAGMPARTPAPPPTPLPVSYRNAEPLEVMDDDDEDDDEPPAPFSSLAGVLQTTIDRAMPLVNHAVNTKVLGLSTEQSIALMGGTAVPAKVAAAPAIDEKPKQKPTPAPASPADFITHMLAIEALLSAKESGLARQAIAEMPPQVLASWREKEHRRDKADFRESWLIPMVCLQGGGSDCLGWQA